MRPRRCCRGFCAALSILHPLFPPLSSHHRLSFSLSHHLSFSCVCLSFSLPLYRAHSLRMFITLYLLSSSALLSCILSLSRSLLFFLFISLTLCFSISRLLSPSAIYFSLFPCTPRSHYYTYSLFFACLRHSDDSDTKLAIPQIVTASYCTINFSHNVSVFQKFLQSLIQAQVLLFNFEKLFIFVCATQNY